MYLLGLLFRVQEHWVMMCCGNVIFRRFCFFGFWSSHINNQRKCLLGDYGEETVQ